jgi:hypothetical protein
VIFDENIFIPFTTIPRGTRVSLIGIDAAGEVAGTYQVDAGQSFGFPLYRTRAFVYSGGASGTYTMLADPAAPSDAGYDIFGINDSGEILGSYYNPSIGTHYFTYSGGSNGTYTPFDVPGAAPGTINIHGFDAAGDIVGEYGDGVSYHGFLAIPSSSLVISGTVSDGYIQGATIFIDSNGDGILNAGEQNTVTGQNGQFTLTGATGPLVALGGTDTSTGLAFHGTLTAPTGYTAVTPLSTLVNAIAAQGGTVAAAEQAVMNAFNIHLSAGQTLSTLDPVAGAQAGNAAATAAFVAGTEVLDTVTMLSSALSGETGSSYQTAFTAVLNSLAQQVGSAASGTQLDLSSSAVISSTLQSAAATLSSTPLNPVLVNTITTQTVAQNTAVLQASSSGANVFTAVSIAATTAQGSASANLQHIAQDTTPPIPAVTNIIIDSRTDLALISGTSEPGSVVSVSDVGRQVGTTTTGSNGTWSIETNAPGNTIHSYTEMAIDLAGNAGSSAGAALYTPAAKKSLIAGSGNDVLIGRPNDVLTGGAGNDTFVFNGNFGRETITDFHPSTVDSHGAVITPGDLIELSQTSFSNFAAVQSHARQAGTDVLLTASSADTITLNNVQLTALQAADFRFL